MMRRTQRFLGRRKKQWVPQDQTEFIRWARTRHNKPITVEDAIKFVYYAQRASDQELFKAAFLIIGEVRTDRTLEEVRVRNATILADTVVATNKKHLQQRLIAYRAKMNTLPNGRELVAQLKQEALGESGNQT